MTKVDLTFPIHEGMTTFPVHWHPTVEITQLGRHGIEGRESRRIVLGTHTGTHCDASSHFIPAGRTVDRIPLDVLIGPAHVLDLSDTPPRTEVGAEVVAGRLGDRRPERLLIRFDWSDRWGTRSYYTDHPYLSPDACEWIVEQGVVLLGLDAPMPDNPEHGFGHDPDSPNHKILLGADVVLVEYLCNLRALRGSEVQLIVLPLKIVDGDGAPARVVAIDEG